MSPLPIAAAGAIKAATAKSMTKAFTMMGKVDWDGVNNAMVSMKDFASSASLVQETMGDIKDQALALVDIALGPMLSEVAIKANELFTALEPLATAFANATGSINTDKLDQFTKNMEVFNHIIASGRNPFEDFLNVLGLVIGRVLGVPPPEEERIIAPPSDRRRDLIIFDEEGF